MKVNNYKSYSYNPKAKYAVKHYQKFIRVKSKDNYVDDIFLDLELTKDKNGKIINTRFPKEIQDDIRAFLHEKKVYYTDTGYLSLRAACYDLKTKDRIELCRRISYKFNKDVNIEKRLKNSGGFFETHKKGLAAIGGGIVLGTAGGLVLNHYKPGLINEKLSKFIANKGWGGSLLNGHIADIARSGSTHVGGAIIGSDVNVIAENTLNLSTNLVSGLAVGLAAGALTTAGYAIYRIAKNSMKRANNHADYNKIDDLDSYLYKEDNEREGEVLTELVNRAKMKGSPAMAM